MITFKPIIIPNNRRKDGTYPVKIRVTFKGVSRRLPTTLVCRQQDLTRSLKIKSADIMAKGNELCERMRKTLQDVSPFDLENWDVDRVVSHIKDRLSEENFHLDFFSWGEQYLRTKSEPTRRAYSCALETLSRFLGSRNLDINDISRSMLVEFMEFVDNEPKIHFNPKTGERTASTSEKISRGASSRHLMKLANIFNQAKNRYNDEDSGKIVIPRSPFSNIPRFFPPANGQRNLGVELMQRIISYQTDDPMIRRSLDAFVVSFGLMGANLADLWSATPIKGKTWIYNRQKTRDRRTDQAEMRVDIPEEILPFIERLQDGSKGWWLPVIHNLGKTKDIATDRINRGLRRFCEAEEIPPFTFYGARHSFASIGRSIGLEKALIDDCLNHKGDFAIADIYAEKSWSLINDANKRIISLFSW